MVVLMMALWRFALGLFVLMHTGAHTGAISDAPIERASDAQVADTELDGAEITSADDLLRALETAGADLRVLVSDIRYIKTFSIQGDTQQRDGRLVFLGDDEGAESDSTRRRFAITFERLVLDNGRRIEDPSTGYTESYAFDGEWLAESQPFEKRFVRRQIVPPGGSWDPLRIGEGPFPIPIQQERAVILERFDAALLEGDADVEERALMGIARKCYQLHLVPRPEIGEEDLEEVRVWYDRETLLPRMARTMNRAEDVSFVILRGMQTNDEAQIIEGELSTEPPTDRRGWDISIEPHAEATP